MSIGIRRPMISSFFLRLSHRSFTIFPSLFLILLSILSWVPLAQLLFGEARPSFDWSGRGWRQWILQPLPFLPPPLFLLRVVVWLSRRSWHNFSALMLALTLSVTSCVRWPPMSIISHDDKLALVTSLLLHLLLPRLLMMRMLLMVMIMMKMRMLALPMMKRWRPLNDLPFVIHDKRGE